MAQLEINLDLKRPQKYATTTYLKKEDCVIDHTCDTGFKTNWLFVCRIKYDMAAQKWNLQRSGCGVRISSKITWMIEQ